MTNRRHFLQTTAAALASFIIPRSLRSTEPGKSFWFIHADSCNSWPVLDPVQGSLENAHEPVPMRAREGLLRLTPDDGDRVVRLVVRRCGLNLLEIHPGQVVVHHWGQQGRADLRPFFKSHRLARKEIEVVLKDRKKEVISPKTGDDFLYGDRIALDFTLELFQIKWASRFEQHPDDWTAAPGTWSGFAWEGVEDNLIPWSALKSAWRRSADSLCLNCDGPTILANFGLRPVGMFNRSPNFVHVCGACRRSFRDESLKDGRAWIEENLDAEVLPDAEMIWGRRVTWEPRASKSFSFMAGTRFLSASTPGPATQSPHPPYASQPGQG